jgi:hypothetical protein
MNLPQTWYIVKSNAGTCEILTNEQIMAKDDAEIADCWGPFTSSDDAISRRIGLIRSGKCKPV